MQLGGRRRSSGIPRSTNSSRDASPSRVKSNYGPSYYNRRPSGGGVAPGSGGKPPKRPVMTESILRQSREAESALADALVSSKFCLAWHSNQNLEFSIIIHD